MHGIFDRSLLRRKPGLMRVSCQISANVIFNHFCRIPVCREILEQKHAATTAAITNEETEILEQLTAVTEACKEETIDSKDQELLALIERRKKTSARRSIKQGIRDNKKSKRHEKIHDILEEFSGTRSIASIRQEQKFSSRM